MNRAPLAFDGPCQQPFDQPSLHNGKEDHHGDNNDHCPEWLPIIQTVPTSLVVRASCGAPTSTMSEDMIYAGA